MSIFWDLTYIFLIEISVLEGLISFDEWLINFLENRGRVLSIDIVIQESHVLDYFFMLLAIEITEFVERVI